MGSKFSGLVQFLARTLLSLRYVSIYDLTLVISGCGGSKQAQDVPMPSPSISLLAPSMQNWALPLACVMGSWSVV
jgi:hypothetical protein